MGSVNQRSTEWRSCPRLRGRSVQPVQRESWDLAYRQIYSGHYPQDPSWRKRTPRSAELWFFSRSCLDWVLVESLPSNGALQLFQLHMCSGLTHSRDLELGHGAEKQKQNKTKNGIALSLWMYFYQTAVHGSPYRRLQMPWSYPLTSLGAALVNNRRHTVMPHLVQFIFSGKTSSISSNIVLSLHWFGLASWFSKINQYIIYCIYPISLCRW